MKAEYRAPGYQETAKKYIDEKPLFAIVCNACGAETMVPFLPDEREEVFCETCYKKRREEKRALSEAAAAEEAGTAREVGAVEAAVDLTSDKAPESNPGPPVEGGESLADDNSAADPDAT